MDVIEWVALEANSMILAEWLIIGVCVGLLVATFLGGYLFGLHRNINGDNSRDS